MLASLAADSAFRRTAVRQPIATGGRRSPRGFVGPVGHGDGHDWTTAFHLDVQVDDIETAVRQVLQLGATRLSGGGHDSRGYADTAGHPFCPEFEA